MFLSLVPVKHQDRVDNELSWKETRAKSQENVDSRSEHGYAIDVAQLHGLAANQNDPPELKPSSTGSSTQLNGLAASQNDPPELKPSSPSSSTVSSFAERAPTPKIQPLTKDNRETVARNFIAENFCPGDAISYDTMKDDGKMRANRLMSTDFSWCPSHGKVNRGGGTTFRAEFEIFCKAREDFLTCLHEEEWAE